jgi:hypothetical protein
VVPAGDTPVVAFVSVSKDEAGARLKTITEILRTIGESFERRGDELEVTGERRVLFKVFACNTSAVVGFTSVAVFGDEVSRWENRDHSANPASQVMGSVMPTLATQPLGFAALCSSPWSSDDYHAECFEQGDTDFQIVSFGTTWDCNPSLTESACRALEPDESTLQREYYGIPQPGLSVALDQEHCRDAMRAVPAGESGRQVMVLDPSSGHGDAFTHALVAWHTTGDQRIMVVSHLEAIEGKWYGVRQFDDIVDDLACKAKKHKVNQIVSDQREDTALLSGFRRHGLRFTSIPWGANKVAAVARLRRLLADRQIILPDDPALKKELANFHQKLMPSGYITFGGRSSGRDDRVAILLTAMMADEDRMLDSSPLKRRSRMFEALKNWDGYKTFENQWPTKRRL